MKRFLLFCFLILYCLHVIPGEGLWLPLLIDSLNYNDMQQKGLQLNADDIYSINNGSLKDAVVLFGNGCTGGLVSDQGLLITNYHCGYSRIQSLSTVEKNYLTDGFWAASRENELPNPGLTVSFLVRIENVTNQALYGIDELQPESERIEKVSYNIAKIRRLAVANTHYDAEVKSFYFGKEYYLFVYEIFRDIRLVAAPPGAIGRFGGDTDNWIWPRHTGDFSLFRIYAGTDNLPASYSPGNVPYKPRKYLTVSLSGVDEGDFTMVLGYPGRTDEYLTSHGLSMIAEKSLPAKIEMRTLRLNALQEEMDKSAAAHLKYTAQYNSISNSWKKWIGVTKGVKRSDALNIKRDQEQLFVRRAAADTTGVPYALLIERFASVYSFYEPLYLANDLGNEFLSSFQLFGFTRNLQPLVSTLLDSSIAARKKTVDRISSMGRNLLGSEAVKVDRKIMADFLRIYAAHVAPDYHPGTISTVSQQYDGDYRAYTDFLFSTSVFTDSIKFVRLIKKRPSKIASTIINDPVVSLQRDFGQVLSYKVYGALDSINLELNRLYRNYIGARMQMDTGRTFYSDANSTMRLAYGRAEGYNGADAVQYNYMTTLDGVMEKEGMELADYSLIPELSALYDKKDYGRFAQDGRMPVCFIASNHTSGGNSGSPVLNCRGELVGLNFDRNWEGTVSDYVYDPAVCRNICLDIRYVLFVIEKIGKAPWILDEFTVTGQ